MGLRVHLGFDTHWLNENEQIEVLKTIVETGSVDLIRTLMTSDDESVRIMEVRKASDAVTPRILEEDETQTILAEIETIKGKFGELSARFSWDEAERLAFDVQAITVGYSADADPMVKHEFRIGSDRVRMISIARSKKFNWAGRSLNCRLARALHEVAEHHHLVVHSA